MNTLSSFIQVFDLGNCPIPQYLSKTLLNPWVPSWCLLPRNGLNTRQRIHNAMDAVHWDVSRFWTNSVRNPWTPWVHHTMRLAGGDPQWRWWVCGRRWWANHWQHRSARSEWCWLLWDEWVGHTLFKSVHSKVYLPDPQCWPRQSPNRTIRHRFHCKQQQHLSLMLPFLQLQLLISLQCVWRWGYVLKATFVSALVLVDGYTLWWSCPTCCWRASIDALSNMSLRALWQRYG